jgi:hypothetical protein
MKKLTLTLTGLIGLSLGFWLTSDRLQAACYYGCSCSTVFCDPCQTDQPFAYSGCEIQCYLGTCVCHGEGGPMSCG